MQGLILCAIAGAIDGCWSVFATGASMRGLDHYVACFYMCLGFLLPLFICELLLFCSNPAKFIAECKVSIYTAQSAVILSPSCSWNTLPTAANTDSPPTRPRAHEPLHQCARAPARPCLFPSALR